MSESNPSLNDSIGRVLGIFARHRWWIMGTAFIAPLIAIIVVFNLHDRYTSEATLSVVQQQVSPKYVDPAMTLDNADLIKGMTRTILSGPRLLAIIDAFSLYSDLRHRIQADKLVERMRKDIDVHPLDQLAPRSEYAAFSVSYTSDNPRLAQDVTSRLTSLFIEENLKIQGAQAATTTKFLAEQLEAAKQRLSDQERKLQQFKSANLGSLPEQEQANLLALSDVRMQMQSAAITASRAQQQRISVEALLNGMLARLRSDRTSLLAQYTPKHPEVLKKDQEIESVNDLLASLNTGVMPPPQAPATGSLEDPAAAQLRTQVAGILADLETSVKEQSKLRSQAAQYQGQIRLTPIKQQQLSEILRDYELYKSDYTDLLNKQFRSQMTANLAEHQDSQQFRLVDPPTLPSVPSSPQRLKVSLVSLPAGIAIGLALAFLCELLKQTFHSEREVKHRLKAPLVVGVPLIRTPKEEERRRWAIAAECVAGCSLLVIVAVAEYWVYLHS